MDPTIPTPTVSSTVTSTSISTPPQPPTPLTLLEISLISAQDIAPISKSMRTYATAWMNPSRKHNTKTDHHGHTHPTWNDKFTFRLDNKTLVSEDAAITVEIYMVSWFRDVLIGTVSVLISDLLSPPSGIPLRNLPKNMRFVALQVRRPSGAPQGILNMGVALLDSTLRSMPLQYYVAKSSVETDNTFGEEIEKKVKALNLIKNEYDDQEDGEDELEKKIQLWRSLSVGSGLNGDEFQNKNGSVCNGSMVNGSMVNGSELCSDIGPSASIVAAELAQKFQPLPPLKPPTNQTMKLHSNEDSGSSILEDLTIEEAQAKGFRMRTSKDRWRKEIAHSDCDDSELSTTSTKHSRRNSDGGLFTCFGNAYGIEVRIVCGASNKPNNSSSKGKNSKPTTNANSEANSA